jgi:hypothetical protein
MYASTTPGRTACETASPIRDQPMRTSQQLRTAQTTAASAVVRMARTIKS